MENVAQLISDFGFPIVMAVGMGYFVYFVYKTILEEVDPAIEEMKITIIRLIDQLKVTRPRHDSFTRESKHGFRDEEK